MSVPSNLSKEFVDFVKAIGDSKSKQEEDGIVVNEMSKLKKRIMDTKCDNVGSNGFDLWIAHNQGEYAVYDLL